MLILCVPQRSPFMVKENRINILSLTALTHIFFKFNLTRTLQDLTKLISSSAFN